MAADSEYCALVDPWRFFVEGNGERNWRNVLENVDLVESFVSNKNLAYVRFVFVFFRVRVGGIDHRNLKSIELHF